MKAKIVFTGITSKDTKTGNKYWNSEILETSEDKFQLGLRSLTELSCHVIFAELKKGQFLIYFIINVSSYMS